MAHWLERRHRARWVENHVVTVGEWLRVAESGGEWLRVAASGGEWLVPIKENSFEKIQSNVRAGKPSSLSKRLCQSCLGIIVLTCVQGQITFFN
jgi:hypothetical protein